MPDAPVTRTLFRNDPARPGQQIATEPYCGHLSGRVTPQLSPRPEDHVIDDIALGLTRIRRFGGQTGRYYSVAEHCVRVSDHLGEIAQPARVQLAGLLHEAVEYLTGDIPPPVRDALRLMDGRGFAETFRVFEQRHQRAIHRMAGPAGGSARRLVGDHPHRRPAPAGDRNPRSPPRSLAGMDRRPGRGKRTAHRQDPSVDALRCRGLLPRPLPTALRAPGPGAGADLRRRS